MPFYLKILLKRYKTGLKLKFRQENVNFFESKLLTRNFEFKCTGDLRVGTVSFGTFQI